MKALTIGGQAGAGAPEVGLRISKLVGARYIEQQALRKLARNLGATAEAVTRKELAFGSRKDRFIQQLELMFSKFGWYGADLSMGFTPTVELLEEMADPVKRLPADISEKQYIDGIYETAQSFVDDGDDLLLVKRAGVVTLTDQPEVKHIGLFAPKEFRVARLASRLKIGTTEAEDIVTGLEHARSAWFAKIADADPMDKSLYDEVFDLGSDLTDEEVASIVSQELPEFDPSKQEEDGYDTLQGLLNPPH